MQPGEFGSTNSGQTIWLYTIGDPHGAHATISNYGATLVSLFTPDKQGIFDDIVLGFENVGGYLANPDIYCGGIIGRYANRIARGRFTLAGDAYQLQVNNGRNHLHGGPLGFDKVIWNAQQIRVDGCDAVELTYMSTDGEEGYPGNLAVKVQYILMPPCELRIEYSATTDRATIINLTQHSYFNLAGPEGKDILSHQLWLNSDCFTPIDESLIPTGELRSVTNTPFDFRVLTRIGDRLQEQDEQLALGHGFDHNWILNGRVGELQHAASLLEPESHRLLEVWTTEPGLQFYSGNALNGAAGKGGKVYAQHSGLCLESQHYPDAPNIDEFPSTVLRPGDAFRSTTVYKLRTAN